MNIWNVHVVPEKNAVHTFHSKHQMATWIYVNVSEHNRRILSKAEKKLLFKPFFFFVFFFFQENETKRLEIKSVKNNGKLLVAEIPSK